MKNTNNSEDVSTCRLHGSAEMCPKQHREKIAKNDRQYLQIFIITSTFVDFS
jgi:hypothetical protein